jgi:hypothetical protein
MNFEFQTFLEAWLICMYRIKHNTAFRNASGRQSHRSSLPQKKASNYERNFIKNSYDFIYVIEYLKYWWDFFFIVSFLENILWLYVGNNICIYICIQFYSCRKEKHAFRIPIRCCF